MTQVIRAIEAWFEPAKDENSGVILRIDKDEAYKLFYPDENE